MEGIDNFIDGLDKYVKTPTYPKEFAGRVFNISRDKQGNRLTHMKITGGSLQVKRQLGRRRLTRYVFTQVQDMML